MGYNIYHDVHISASDKQVYEAVTKPQHLVNWWPLKCTGKAVLDTTYNFYFSPEYDWFGKVLKVEKNVSFHIKMTKSDRDWDPTSFGFDLMSEKDGTLLQFWHTDWPHCNAHFKKSSYCWALLLKGLKDYVENKRVIPFGARA